MLKCSPFDYIAVLTGGLANVLGKPTQKKIRKRKQLQNSINTALLLVAKNAVLLYTSQK